jgi:tetratricopeptide (TPR) repeat protein
MSISGALGAVFGWKLLENSGEILDKVGEKIFGGSAKAFAEEATAKLKYHTGAIPPNHDLEHAIRISELTSTLVLLGQYKDRKEQERLDRGGLSNEPFVPAARLFVHQQFGKSLGAKTKSDAELVAELDQKLDLAFSEHDAERVRAGLDAAQARVWSDLVAGGGEPPPDFKQLFDGDGNGENPGWALVFVAFMREALKKSPKAQVAFVASRLGTLRETMGALQEKADSIKDDTAALLTFAREAARTRNVAEGFIQEMAARVARDRALDFEGQIRAVREAIEIYEERIAGGLTQTNFGDIVDAALAKAKAQVDKGQSGLARATLRKAAEDLQREEKERRAAYLAGVTELYNRARDIALASYDGEAAAEAVVALAEAVHGADRAGVYEALRAETRALYNHGDEKGSNVHLRAAIAVLRKLLDYASSEDERSRAHNNLGVVLQRLGERESGTVRLDEAVAAFSEALKEWTRERVPLDWATTQNNLGSALARLGERESGTARLDEAVAAYHEALRVFPT